MQLTRPLLMLVLLISTSIGNAEASVNNERVLFAENWGGSYFYSNYSSEIGKVYFSYCTNEGTNIQDRVSCKVLNPDGIPFENLRTYQNAFISSLKNIRADLQVQLNESYFEKYTSMPQGYATLGVVISNIESAGIQDWILTQSLASLKMAPDLGSPSLIKQVVSELQKVINDPVLADGPPCLCL